MQTRLKSLNIELRDYCCIFRGSCIDHSSEAGGRVKRNSRLSPTFANLLSAIIQLLVYCILRGKRIISMFSVNIALGGVRQLHLQKLICISTTALMKWF